MGNVALWESYAANMRAWNDVKMIIDALMLQERLTVHPAFQLTTLPCDLGWARTTASARLKHLKLPALRPPHQATCPLSISRPSTDLGEQQSSIALRSSIRKHVMPSNQRILHKDLSNIICDKLPSFTPVVLDVYGWFVRHGPIKLHSLVLSHCMTYLQVSRCSSLS